MLYNIVQKDPPPIDAKWSAEFQDFVKKCLDKNPAKRWSGEKLLEHPFLAGADTEELRQEWVKEFANWKNSSYDMESLK